MAAAGAIGIGGATVGAFWYDHGDSKSSPHSHVDSAARHRVRCQFSMVTPTGVSTDPDRCACPDHCFERVCGHRLRQPPTKTNQITVPGPSVDELSNLANPITCIDFSVGDWER